MSININFKKKNMKKKNKILIYALMGILLMLTNNCSKDKNDVVKYSTNDLEGIWSGNLRIAFHGGSNDGRDTVYTTKFTFGTNGTFISMVPSPDYLSKSGNLTVDEAGKISGIITTTHKTDLVNIETTTMNWSGSSFETKTKINIDMNWPWVNTAPGNGYFIITGSLNKQ
jgi:hypothetical protein